MKRAIMIAIAATLWMGLAHADPGDDGTDGAEQAPPAAQHRAAPAKPGVLKAGQGKGTVGQATHATQQEKMRRCNADARGLKGDERRHFMSTCLSGKNG